MLDYYKGHAMLDYYKGHAMLDYYKGDAMLDHYKGHAMLDYYKGDGMLFMMTTTKQLPRFRPIPANHRTTEQPTRQMAECLQLPWLHKSYGAAVAPQVLQSCRV